MKDKNQYPKGWDRHRVCDVIQHYENQTEDHAVAEDKAAYEDIVETHMSVPVELVPAVRDMIARHQKSQ